LSPLEHYNTLGIIIIVISIVSLLLMYRVNKMVKSDSDKKIPDVLAIPEI
jgi:hypothetical protein